MEAPAGPASRLPAVRRHGRRLPAVLGGAVVVSVATGLAGVLAYAFQVLAARALGPAAFGQVGALWGGTFLLGIVLFRPLEQTTSRALADRLARGDEVRTALRAVALVGVALAAAFAVTLVLLTPLVSRRLFAGDRTMTVLLGIGVVGYGAQYVSRGVAAGVRWFRGYAAILLGDGAFRLALALPLALVASRHVAAAAIALAGGLAPLAALTGARERLRSLGRRGTGAPFDVRAALAFAAPAGAIAGADQLLVNGAPLLVLLDGGRDASRAAGVVFAATMLVRIPVFVFQGLAATLLPNVARRNALAGRRPSTRALARASACFAAAAAVLVAAVGLLGPWALHVVFGSGYAAGRGGLALLALGVGLYLPAAALSQTLLALDRGPRASLAWLGGACVFVACFLVVPGGAVFRAGVALAAATGVCLAGLVLQAAPGRRAR